MVEIIKSIDIKYFRSIYRGGLSEVADVNVISGRNDAGKSNF